MFIVVKGSVVVCWMFFLWNIKIEKVSFVIYYLALFQKANDVCASKACLIKIQQKPRWKGEKKESFIDQIGSVQFLSTKEEYKKQSNILPDNTSKF